MCYGQPVVLKFHVIQTVAVSMNLDDFLLTYYSATSDIGESVSNLLHAEQHCLILL